jgi:hypothetical protein
MKRFVRTRFFFLLKESSPLARNHKALAFAYDEFAHTLFSECINNTNSKTLYQALCYTHVELNSLCLKEHNKKSPVVFYLKKAMSLIDIESEHIFRLLYEEQELHCHPLRKYSRAKKPKCTNSQVEQAGLDYTMYGAEYFNDGKITLKNFFSTLKKLFRNSFY